MSEDVFQQGNGARPIRLGGHAVNPQDPYPIYWLPAEPNQLIPSGPPANYAEKLVRMHCALARLKGAMQAIQDAASKSSDAIKLAGEVIARLDEAMEDKP